MSDDEQRIAIAEACGYRGCTDVNCEVRKAAHLHSATGAVCFPEPYSTSRYPDYLNDLNACHEMEKTLDDFKYREFCDALVSLIMGHDGTIGQNWLNCSLSARQLAVKATAAQRCEAFLRTIGKWRDTDAPNAILSAKP